MTTSLLRPTHNVRRAFFSPAYLAGLTLIFPLLSLAACNSASENTIVTRADDNESFRQWKLPGKLREISGLALTADGRLLAVTDEEAIVYELDFETGSMLKAFALGKPTVRADFEGIAVLGDAVWLLTSDGHLYRAAEGADGERVSFIQFDTDLGEYCEFEGLAADAGRQQLLLACKETRSKRDSLRVFRLAVVDGQVELAGQLEFDEAALSARIGRENARPSGIAIDPDTGDLLLIAANHRAVITLSPDGDLIEAIILPGKGRHRQPEGIAITSDRRLLIADEGRSGKATLAVYRRTDNGLEPELEE